MKVPLRTLGFAPTPTNHDKDNNNIDTMIIYLKNSFLVEGLPSLTN